MTRGTKPSIQATAPNGVCKGDKESPDTTAMYNDTHVTDIVEVGGEPHTGGDVCHEVKVKAVTTAGHSLGKGTLAGGGSPATNGHIFGFGCTYDKTLREVKGVEECGRPQDGPFDHVTGHGWVKRFGPPAPSPTDPQRVMPGAQYYDAIHNKNNKVTLWLVEPTGAIHHEAVADLRRRARCATSAPSARDGTKYGAGRHATRSYLTHHTQRIALAASRYEACHIIHVINQEKGCLARGERGRWVGQRAAATAGPPARTPAAEAGEGE